MAFRQKSLVWRISARFFTSSASSRAVSPSFGCIAWLLQDPDVVFHSSGLVFSTCLEQRRDGTETIW